MIWIYTLLWGCSSPTPNSSWINGELERDSLLEQQENDENESEGGELLEVWYGELWDVNIGEGFEEGEFGFALMGDTNDDDIIHCQIHRPI